MKIEKVSWEASHKSLLDELNEVKNEQTMHDQIKDATCLKNLHNVIATNEEPSSKKSYYTLVLKFLIIIELGEVL